MSAAADKRTPDPRAAVARAVADGAGRCVQCGLCLPACPTYGLLREEADSPRGRLALARALAVGALAPDAGLTMHLRRCLLCRACEAMCPAGVPFAEVMDGARALLRGAGAPDRTAPLRRLLAWPRLLGTGVRLIRGAARRGLLRAGWMPARWRALTAGLAQTPAPRRLRGRASGPAGGPPVWLFTGCTGEVLDGQTAADAIAVLAALGFRVRVPAERLCCGALHLHAGFPEEAARKVAAVARALERDDAPVLAIASGCALRLAEAGRPGEPGLAARARELTGFLATAPWPRTPPLRPLGLRVLAHAPCTLRHGLQAGDAVRALLARLPGVTVLEPEEVPGCCGAAGTYLVEEPTLAEALRRPWEEMLARLRPDVVATPNLGCALQLRAAAHTAGLRAEVLHPVSLLAGALLS